MKGPKEIKPAGGVRGIPEKNEIKAARPPKDVKAVKTPVAPKPVRRTLSKRERVLRAIRSKGKA